MKKIKVILFLVTILFITSSYEILSKKEESGTKFINLTKTQNRLDSIEEGVYIFLEFEGGLVNNNRILFEAENISFAQYFGDNKWVVSLPKEKIKFVEQNGNISVLRDLDLLEKGLKDFSGDNLPVYAKNIDGNLNINLLCYKDVKKNTCKNLILEHGGSIIEDVGLNFFKISIAKADLIQLTDENEVMSIEEISPPSKNHLFLSRSSIGADTLQSVSFLWG